MVMRPLGVVDSVKIWCAAHRSLAPRYDGKDRGCTSWRAGPHFCLRVVLVPTIWGDLATRLYALESLNQESDDWEEVALHRTLFALLDSRSLFNRWGCEFDIAPDVDKAKRPSSSSSPCLAFVKVQEKAGGLYRELARSSTGTLQTTGSGLSKRQPSLKTIVTEKGFIEERTGPCAMQVPIAMFENASE